MTPSLIAVTGSTGLLGGRLALRLAAEGARQRLIVRDPSRAPSLPGTEIAVAGGYSDAVGMRAALDGADTLFLVSGREAADRVEQHVAAIDAAVDAGVTRIVYTSFLGASPTSTFTLGRQHWATEQHLRGTGVRFTLLRDSFYHAMFGHLVGADGVIRGPAGTGRVASVAHDDVADVATAVLLDERADVHDGRAYDVTGPEPISMADAAAHLTRATGREIRYEPETVDQAYASRAHYGAPAYEVEGWVTSYTAIGAGDLEVVSPTVPRLTARDAQSFPQWLEANPQALEHLRA
ncbi:NmrA family NAD(P)-binding protein [Pengzhenrongella sicca]|uniref:NmrA family NAD(P)-binding protein n=1 Tax=Pengzhenrongella sicca TaxID=2819238 RepID=A0A8A4ZDZ4_9MICO|nr:NmrA family NAD(P)-binding protein [Pengzhenrongella sicca]QTE29535.1 NmrA family NAD(P)-binding protein [Pengzhenrongella sicca]